MSDSDDSSYFEDSKPPAVPILTLSQNPQLTPQQTFTNVMASQIDGRGMYNNWRRQFSSPEEAIWDIMDNAFDACLDGNNEEHTIAIDPDKACWNVQKRGMVFRNTCTSKISPISEILKAYKSSKADNVSIGENGVGVKQSCATLSDLSFILVRNKNEYSLGIIAKDLQRLDGICLPHFTFYPVSKTLTSEVTIVDVEAFELTIFYLTNTARATPQNRPKYWRTYVS